MVTVLPEHDAAGPPNHRHHRGVRLRPVAGIDRRAVGGRKLGGVEDVLDADGKPAQRQRRSSGSLGAPPRRLEVERGEGADLRFARGNGLRAEIEHGARRELAGLDPASKIERGKHQCRPSSTAMIRSVSRCAGGMTRNAVKAAIGQATK